MENQLYNILRLSFKKNFRIFSFLISFVVFCFGLQTFIVGNPSDFMSVTVNANSVKWEWTASSTSTYYLHDEVHSVKGSVASAGIGVKTSITETGLSANVLYARHVTTVTAGNETYSNIYSTYTRASTPGVPTLGVVSLSQLTVDINENGNSADTVYAIRINGGGYSNKFIQANGTVSGSAVYQTYASWGSNKLVTGLTANTQYTFAVIAKNVSEVVSAYSGSASIWTLANQAINPRHSTIGTASITWEWTSGGSQTDYAYGNTAAVSSGTTDTGTTWPQTGLPVNSLHILHVSARNGDGVKCSGTISTHAYTAANIPASPTLTNNLSNDMYVNINPNSNPSITEFAIKIDGGGYSDKYVQPDGSVGSSAVWRKDGEWGNQYVTGLSSNTQYTFSVKARNGDLAETTFASGNLYTLAGIPGPLSVGTVKNNSIAVSWTANGNPNPPGTTYIVETSGDGSSWSILTTTTSLNTVHSILDADKLYYYRVKARNGNSVESGYNASISTYTLSNIPSAPTLSNNGLTGINCDINVNSNPAWTTYAIKVSSGAADYFVQDNGTLGLSKIFFIDSYWGNKSVIGLSTNTMYNFSAIAKNQNNIETDASPVASLSTLADVPANLNFAVTYSSITLFWSGETNPYGTHYGISYSTFSNFSTIVTTLSYSGNLILQTKTFDFADLENTTFWFRLWAYNNNGVATAHISGSTKTLYGPVEVPINLTATSLIGSTSIQWRFNNNEHNINNLTSIVLATGPYTDVYSWMYQMSPSTGGARFDLWQGTSALGGLIPNTSYTVTAGALNSVYSSWTASVSTYTLAAVPQISSIGNIGTSSITVNWTGNGNPSYTQYEVDCSTVSPSFDPMVHKIYFNEGLTAAATTIFNLSPDTVYHFRIRARNQTGVVTVYSNIFSSQTLASVPDPLSFLDVAITSMSVHISSAGNPSNTSYAIKIAAAAGSGVKYVRRSDGVLITAPDYNLKSQWDGTYVIGLSTNVQYTFNVIAKNGQGIITDESIAVSTYTLASIPSGFDISGDLTHTGVTLSWNANTNPAGTKYGIIISSTSNFAEAEQQVVYSDGLTDTTKMFTHPFSNTTHYFSVWAYNEDRVATGKVNLAKMRRVLPPTDLAACSYVLYYSTVSGNDQYSKFIDISWKGSADKYTAEYYNIFRSTWPGGSYYYVDRVPANTNIDNYSYRDNSTVVNSERSIGTMATYYYVITTSDVYKFGSEISQEKKAEMDSAAPLLDVSAIYKINSLGGNVYIDVTANDYRDVSKTSAGKIDSITMFYRRYGVSVLGSWTSAAFDTSLNGGHSYSGTAAIPAGFIADCLKAGISAGHNYGELEYEIKVHDGGNSVSAVYIATVTFITEDQITRASGGTLTVPDGNSDDGDTSIVIPSLALTGDAVITIEQRGYPGDANPPPLAFENEQTDMIASGSTAPLVCFDFGPDNLKFDQPVLITLKYLDENNDGVVDTHTQVQEKDLRMFWWDGFGWKYISDYVDKDNPVDTAKKTLSAYVNHFTLFALFPAGVIPVKPTPVEKFITPATKDGCNDRIQFQCESAITKIEIYNITGKKVKSVENMDNWDGTDDDGNIVESGVYIYLVESANGKKRTGAVVVAK